MKKSLVFFMAVLTLVIYPPSSPAKTYKYVDRDGVAHYTNVPNHPKYKPASGYINQESKKKNKKPVKKVRTH